MRKITLLLMINLFCAPFLVAQFEVTGSEDFGRIFGVTYDKTAENKLYAITMGNHILSSVDNGQNWDIFHAVQNGYFGKFENNLKTYGDGQLSYVLQYGQNAVASRTLYLLDIATQTISYEYIAPMPDPASEANWITSYSISETDPDVALVSLGYKIGLSNYEKTFYTTNGGDSWQEVYST